MLSKFLAAESFVLHTYAASAIERMLSLRDKQERPAPLLPVMVPRLTAEHAAPLLMPIFSTLFARMNSPAYPGVFSWFSRAVGSDFCVPICRSAYVKPHPLPYYNIFFRERVLDEDCPANLYSLQGPCCSLRCGHYQTAHGGARKGVLVARSIVVVCFRS